MLKFSFHATNLVNEASFNESVEELNSYTQELKSRLSENSYSIPESSLLLPNDDSVLTRVNEILEKYDSPELGSIALIGIGGSNLGAWAVYDALKFKKLERKIHFVETVDPVSLTDTLESIETQYQNGKHTLVIWISKSGSTSETIANFGAFIEKFATIDKSWTEHTLVITGQDSKLWNYAKQHNLETTIHEEVGGRYSVMSSVGLIPLALAGVDVPELRTGAQQALSVLSSNNPDENPALASAISIYLNSIQGKNIHNTFTFVPQLATFGRWYRQLVGESLGKDGKGITPITSVGSTDLHSVGQLYFGGPSDKFTTFVSASELPINHSVPQDLELGKIVADIEGNSLHGLMQAIEQGVKKAYQKQRLPYVEITLDKLGESELGELLQFKMIETMFVAKLMNVNAFDQPQVELYKDETRKILSEQNPTE